MHEDDTEHDWRTLMVREQGLLMPAWTMCHVCGLSAYELLQDQVAYETGVESPPDPTPEMVAVQAMNLMFSGVALDLDAHLEG